MFEMLKLFFRAHWRAVLYFYEIDCYLYAAALALFTIISIVPISLLFLAIIAKTPWLHAVTINFKQALLDALMPNAMEQVQLYFDQAMQGVHHFSILLWCIFLISALFMVLDMQAVFDRIWRVRQTGLWTVIRRFMRAITVLVMLPLMIIVFYVCMHMMANTSWYHQLPILHVFVDYFSQSLFFILTCLFTIIFYMLSDHRAYFFVSVLSALCTSFYLYLAKYLFHIYLNMTTTYSLLYGALATIPITCLWLYFIWMIIFFGMILSYCMTMGLRKAT